MSRPIYVAILCAAMLADLPRADARPNYEQLIPNTLGCGTCHRSEGGAGPRNGFGEDFGRFDNDWSQIFDLDSDRDGFSNGRELGDPDGLWLPNDPRPDAIATHPGDASDVPIEFGCGNGLRDDDEDCDIDDLGGQTCVGLDFEGGFLACRDDCTFDVSACLLCGDGVQQDGEACDGFELGGRSCNTEGFTAGRLVCTPECTLDAAGCTTCGDGIQAGDEACDGDDLDGASCPDLIPDTQGALTCASDCTLELDLCKEGTDPQPDPLPTPEPAPNPNSDGGCHQAPGSPPASGGPWAWLALMLAAGLRRQASHEATLRLQ